MRTILVGINLREKAERDKRSQITRIIKEAQMLTANQAANILDISVNEADLKLIQLCRESRIDVGNRSGDMAVVYIPMN